MWPVRRIFLSFTLCSVLLGLLCVVRLRLNRTTKLLPEFLPDVPRFRPSRICATKALILVNSAPRNVHRRQIIRETWGHPSVTGSLDMKVSFGVGSSGDVHTQRPLDWEAETFGDIFQTPLLDTYDALPRKMLHLLNMAHSACAPRPNFVVKVDDDMFVNIFALSDLLGNLEPQTSEKFIWCLVWHGMPVIRAENSKWAVSEEEFSNSTYPTYCSGSAYILNAKVLEILLLQHQNQENGRSVFPLEDVYITGMLANEAGIGHIQLGSRYAFESIREDHVAEGKTVFAHLGMKVVEQTDSLWNAVIKEKMVESHGSEV